MKVSLSILGVIALAITAQAAWAVVQYDRGRELIEGVQLLQDNADPLAYYYLPQVPRLSTRPDGTPEFLCMKYVSPDPKRSGGLFHAVVEFTLPPELVTRLEEKLQDKYPAARLVGPVPLMQAEDKGEDAVGSFQVVSGVLSATGEGGFTRSVITSGKAPVTPGSKAVVAALLTAEGATLLWSSLTGPTSDVSVAIHAYYEAAVQAYNARVTADVSTVYEHLSKLSNYQKNYTRRQLRDIMDNLQRDGTLKVEVFDRSAGLGIKTEDMTGILDVVTAKLTDLMFDHETGWAKDPEREAAVEANQIPGRQQRSWFSRTFGKTEDTKYYSDDQYVLKKRQDIRRNTFSLMLDKSTTIKVPVDTAGNLSGLYAQMGTDPRFFRVVNLADTAFEFRTVHFQVDGAFVDAFRDTINFVSVNFRKKYPAQPDFTASLTFTHSDITAGRTMQEISFPRLGVQSADWLQYEYQVRWSLRNNATLSVPRKEDQWISSGDPAVSLTPPIVKRVVEIDADRKLLRDNGVASSVVDFATILLGRPQMQRRAILRATDADAVTTLALYGDPDEPVAYRVTWYSPRATDAGKLQILDSDYLYLSPPNMNPPPAETPTTQPTTPPAPTPAPTPEAAPAGGGG